MGSGFISPVNFGMVEEDLYRSGQPNELNFPFLEHLGIKKVIYLSPDEPDSVFFDWLKYQQIELIHLGKNETGSSSWNILSEETVLKALRIILLDSSNLPLHIMDHLGGIKRAPSWGACEKRSNGVSLPYSTSIADLQAAK